MYNEKDFKRMSSFYVNEVHLITMLFPFIERKLQEESEIYTYLQNDLEKTVKMLLSRLNLKEDLKEKINKIDWKEKQLVESKNLSINQQNNIQKFIIVSGNDKYIKEVNKNIQKLDKISKEKIVIINCYNIVEFNKNIKSILDNTDMILNTSGEHEIEEVFPEYIKQKKKA